MDATARLMRACPRLLVLAILAVLSAAFIPSAQAQVPLKVLTQAKPAEAQGSSGFEALLQQAERDGSTVIIVRPGGQEAAAPEMPMAMALSSESLLKARQNLKRMIGNAWIYLDYLPESLKAASPDGTVLWLVVAVATAVAGLIAGRLMFWQVTRWARGHFRHLYREEESSLSGKYGYILFRAGWMLLSAGIMFVTAVLVAVIFDSGHKPARDTIFVIVSTYTAYRIVRSVIFRNFFAPNSPSHRLINLSDAAARRLFNHWAVVIAVGAIVIGLCRFILILNPPGSVSDMSMVAVNQDAQNLAFIVGMLLCALMMGALAIIHRDELAGIILGAGDPKKAPLLNRISAVVALPLAIVYLILAWLVSSVRLTLGLPGGYVPVLAPVAVFVAGIFAYAIAAYLLEIVYERRAASHRRRQLLKLQAERRAWRRAQASKELMSEMNEEVRDILEDGDEMTVMAPVQAPSTQSRPYFPAFKAFFQSTIQATILVVCAGELARLWGADLGREGGHPIAAALDILLVVIVAVSLYRAVNGFIDYKIVEEGGTLDGQAGNPGEGEGEGGKSQSRLATLLPIFRNVIVSLLAVFGTMIVLANLGVDVGPLFAGAGVIGIAVGFGAQTLIRDIFSGAFFLVDDAFRKGEYI